MSKKANILLVDDEPSALNTLTAILMNEGYELSTAKSGKEALEKVKEIMPDLILLDVMMPEMNGFEVCKRIRSNASIAEVPIILITALDDNDSLIQGIDAGADDFITKPYDKLRLRARVKAITRLNRYRLLLKERHKFERVIELSPDGILIIDAKGKICLANSAINQMFRTKKKDYMIGKVMLDFLAPESSAEFSEDIKELYSNLTKIKQKQSMFIRIDGESFTAEWRGGALEWNDKNAVQIVIRDVSDRVTTDSALKESEAKWRSVTENSPDHIMTIDQEGKVLFVNRPLPLDLPKEDLIDSSIYKHVPVQFRPVMKKCFQKVINTKKPDRYEIEYPGYDGRIRVFECLVSPIKISDEIVNLILSYRDITERKQAEENLQVSQEEIKAQSHHLEEVNSAMKVLLKQREKDKIELESNVISNVKKLVTPYIEKLKRSALPPAQSALINILEANLNNIISPFAGKMSNQFLSLTPMEIQIANLIKEGRSNKDMADLLGLSQNTILFHRFNIRTKLGIKNRRVNLRTYLIAYE